MKTTMTTILSRIRWPFVYRAKREGERFGDASLVAVGHLAPPAAAGLRSAAWGFYVLLTLPWRTCRWIEDRRRRVFVDARLAPHVLCMFRVRPWLGDVIFTFSIMEWVTKRHRELAECRVEHVPAKLPLRPPFVREFRRTWRWSERRASPNE